MSKKMCVKIEVDHTGHEDWWDVLCKADLFYDPMTGRFFPKIDAIDYIRDYCTKNYVLCNPCLVSGHSPYHHNEVVFEICYKLSIEEIEHIERRTGHE